MDVYNIEDIPDDMKEYFVDAPELGLEETPKEYVNNLCDRFDELNRVLCDDGTFWLNLGDSYAGSGGYSPNAPSNKNGSKQTTIGGGQKNNNGTPVPNDLKQKDLVGIPWRVALEMQSRGWYLRNDIIWHKPSTMPESVTDRCTTSHEHIFLFAKSKDYYYDQDAIREKPKQSTVERDKYSQTENEKNINDGYQNYMNPNCGTHRDNSNGANKRDVWSVNPASFSDAHFAVYPEELIIPCVKAGSPEGGIVYDPFFGAGTTGLVAEKFNRKWLGSELNEDYIEIANERLKKEIDQQKLL